MKDKILSFAGMGIKGRSSSDPLITHLSPTNHPLLQKAWKYTTCIILALLLGVGNMWGEEVKLVSEGTTATQESPDFFDNKTYKSADESYSVNLSTSGTSKSQGGSYDSKKDYYYALGSACDMSSTVSNYFKVAATGCKISKIVVRVHDNSTSQAIFPAVGCVDALPSTSAIGTKNGRKVDVIIDDQKPNSYGSVKRFANATTLTYTFSTNVSEVYFSKQIKAVGLADATAWATYPASSAQSVCLYGIDVYVVPEATADVAPEITAPTTDQSATYTVGDVITPLSVTATGTPAPTYQWYYNSSASTEGATSLGSGAQTASYTPSNAAESDLYYYCIATNSEGSDQSPYFHVTVNAAVATAPSFTSPASEPAVAEYSVGDAISALEVVAAGYPAPTLQWYSNSSKSTEGATLITGAESASYTPSNAAVSDLYFYCVATNASGTAQSEYFHVTVAAVSYCAELVPATSGAEIAVGDVIDLQAGSNGGTMTAINLGTGNLAYNVNGLGFNSKSGPTVKVVLDHNMQVGTKLWIKLMAAGDKTRGLTLKTKTGSNISAFTCWVEGVNGATSGDVETFTYTVVAGDGLEGTNEFQLARNNSVWLQSLKVSNCGAELHALTSAIDPVAAEGKATITLSKNFVENGGTATATYSAIDAAYDFDVWVINGTGASIDDASANPVTITMGSEAATITLKLKAAGTKYPVHFDSKGGSAVADQLVEAGGHASVPTAPTKFKYTFGGWSETDGGSTPANLAEIAINADKIFYAIWTDKVCPTSGTIFSLSQNGSKPSSEIKWTNADNEGVRDVSDFFEVVNGIAALVNNSSSNNQVSITTDPKMKISNDANGWLHLRLECALEEGDVITLDNNSKCIVSYTADKAEGTTYTLPNSSSHTITVPASWDGQDELWFFRQGGGLTITSINIVRPAKYAVTFNMHDHGDAVGPQSVVEGGKVTKPTDPTASGWDFGGWFKESTYDNEWDFENDVVNAATELHAKWTEHTTSSDATLKSLSYTIGGGDPIAIPLVTEQYAYAVELPMGTDIDAPVIAAVANDPNIKDLTIVQTNLGQATVTVTAEDNSTIQSYAITFSVATSKAIQLVFKTGTTPCVGSASTATQILSNNAAVSTYINQITFTNVEGAGDNGAEGGSLNVGKKAGNMFTLSAKPGYAFHAMNFLAKIQDATCEYSINGGAWTELASTNTDGDECYAPFTSGTVHEFRLRSTGAEGVWIRNMQLTIVEACTPIVVAWDEEPVEFEVGKAGQAIAATANNGGTITYGSTDASIVAVDAGNGVLSVAALGSVSLSASTPEGDGSTYCANGGDPIVLSKVVNTYYLVKFDAQNGEAADEVKYFSGDAAIALPATDPTFAGYDFQGWFDAETGGNKYTAAITPAANMTVYAQWVAQCAGATITTQPVGASYLTGRTPADLVCEATAGAGGALTYEWFTCDDDQKTNPVAASATPSTAAAGTFYYFCKVTEDGCGVEAFSDVVTITVTDKDPICLIATTVTGATAHGAVTGFLGEDRGGDAEVNVTKDTYKMDKGKYIGVTLPDGYKFQEGDKVVLSVKTVNNATGFTLFDGKDGEKNLIIDTRDGALVPAGANTVVLPAYAGSQSVYVLRENNNTTGDLNSAIDAIAVYRACAPILNKVAVNGVEGKPNALKEVVFEVAASTTQAQLEAIAFDWVSNDDAWTASHAPVAANAWKFGVANTVTFTDKDGDQSVYTITVNKAAASTNVELATLTVNGNAVTVIPGQAVYNYELPYGTSAAPVVAATAEDANAEVGTITQASSATGSATFTITAEDGTTTRDYTINFSVSKWKEIVIWDGSTMDAVKTVQPADIASWEAVGFTGVENWAYSTDEPNGKVPAYCSDNDKTYTHVNSSSKNECNIFRTGGNTKNTRYFKITVPKDYVAKFYVVYGSHSEGTEVTMSIGNEASATATDGILSLTTDHRYLLSGGISEIVGAGDYYLNATASADFFEIRAYLRKGYVRTEMLGNGVLGTVCVDHNVAIEDIQGATFYELQGRDYTNYGKLAFDEITSGELEAGAPYVFQAHGDKLVLFYGETSVADPVDKGNGMYGTFEKIVLTELEDIYYFAQKALWSCEGAEDLTVKANRAYVKLSEVDALEAGQQNPAPGRRRILMGVNGEKVATGIGDVQGDEVQSSKVLINGQLFILRGEKMYDATGRLVK